MSESAQKGEKIEVYKRQGRIDPARGAALYDS